MCPRDYFVKWYIIRKELEACFRKVPLKMRSNAIFLTYVTLCPPTDYLMGSLLSPNISTSTELGQIEELIFRCQTQLTRGTREYVQFNNTTEMYTTDANVTRPTGTDSAIGVTTTKISGNGGVHKRNDLIVLLAFIFVRFLENLHSHWYAL
ncbi:hypothetical protein FGIG_07813 [Fasciola gigantica]|uniref:Uncharacterized protein n=1 Tax=Fasciola gigantica TaxID=46835 RepID=A0A504Y9A4_FASGI|nr:hypothetical protein FGIG_07813 [Fasciola gigantica]